MQVDLINAACGYRWTVDDMLTAGERGWNMKRAINNRLGLTAANDRLPKPLLEPFPSGGSEGFVPDIQGMLKTYYEARGWDGATGISLPPETPAARPRRRRPRPLECLIYVLPIRRLMLQHYPHGYE